MNLPATAYQVGSSTVPTPQRIIDGGHRGFGFMGGQHRVVAGARRRHKRRKPVAGATTADAIRLASGGGKSVSGGGMEPPAYTIFPSYPGNAQRRDVVRGMAGAAYPPSYLDYPGNQQRRSQGRVGAAHRLNYVDAVRNGYAGHSHHHHDHGHGHDHGGGACCDSCAGGGPCEGCDGAGGCGKPNCGCS